MPDRAIIAILPALSLGFIGGLISTMLQLEPGPTLLIAITGGVLVALAGASSTFGVRGEPGEKAIVAALRGACALALYACMFLFILTFLEGEILKSLIWVAVGAALGISLAQLRVRDRGELRTE